MPSGAHRAGTGTSSRGYPRGASSWTTRERIWHAHEPLEDMLSDDQHGAPVPAADAAAAAAAAALRIVPGAPLTAELNPAAAAVAVGTSCDSNGALIEDEPDALALVRTAGRGHPFTLQPLKVWWVDDAGGSRPLVAIGGLTAQLGLWSLYYDIALVADEMMKAASSRPKAIITVVAIASSDVVGSMSRGTIPKERPAPQKKECQYFRLRSFELSSHAGGSSYSHRARLGSHGTSSAGSNQSRISRAALSSSLLLCTRLRRQCTP